MAVRNGGVSDGPDAVAALLPLTPAVRDRLEAYVALVRRWQEVKNLVAPSTLPVIWSRHVADSAQALLAAPMARRWLDLGSGAGFPGLVTAILIADEPGAAVTLVEANGRKAAFLMAVARELKLPVKVISERIESVAQRHADIGAVDAVSARALAGLPQLLAYAEPWLAAGALGVFHKGQDFGNECQDATHAWVFDLVKHPSRIEADSVVAVLSAVRRR